MVAVQLHGRFDVLVEKVHGAVPIDLIRMRNADGIHALLRRKAAQSKMMCLDLAVQLSQTGSVEILQMEVGAARQIPENNPTYSACNDNLLHTTVKVPSLLLLFL